MFKILSITSLAAAACLACLALGGQKESSIQTADAQSTQYQSAKSSAHTFVNHRRPRILSRQEWKAKDPVGEMQPHTPQRITIHHTATDQKKEIPIEKKMQNLQSFSQSASRLASGKEKPAWPDVPYHYYVSVDGQIAEGRDIRYVGDTNTEYDPRGHALVVLEGNFENELPSARQLESLGELVAWLSVKYEIPISEFKAHNDYASTACPGVNLTQLLPALRQRIARIIGMVDRK